MQLESNRLEFEKLGVKVAAMTYDDLAILKGFHTSESLGYPLLRDVDAEHMIAYGILNEDYEKGHRSYGIPHPGIMYVAPDGEVLAKFAVPGYRKRPPFSQLLEAVGATL